MKNNSLLLTILTSSVLFLPLQSYAIKKCQDADGNWHYGDVSNSACDNSDVTTLTDNGFIADTDPAPKTEEELKTEQELLEKKEAESLRLKRIEDENMRILSIYETEDDIDRQRDNQLNSVDGNIKVHEAYLKSMDVRISRYENDLATETRQYLKDQLTTDIEAAKARVVKSSQELTQLKEQRADIVEKFKKEKEIYLALKNPQ